MEESSQQFHLKWNNHSLNTLSSFQHLLDTNSLVDVSLTCCNGKTVTAHRMVLAACSEYFYHLFKELPEKHPVIIFKDASEEIVRDLLLFMYKGEVEVQESNLNDFLKFAYTLKVKGLSNCERDAVEEPIKKRQCIRGGSDASIVMDSPTKSNNDSIGPTDAVAACVTPDMANSYLMAASFAAGNFPSMFPLPTEPRSAADLLTHLSSPNLYRALHTRKYSNPLGRKFSDLQENQMLNMPSLLDLKKMFRGNNASIATAAADLSALYPRDDNDSDGIAAHSPPSPSFAHQPSNPSANTDKNERDDQDDSSPMEADYSPSLNVDTNQSVLNLTSGASDQREGQDSDSSTTPSLRRGGSKQGAAGRGSRLERMIAAEYKIMSEYTEQNQDLPVMTPELMKSRRTHSLQLAIGEILHNRASVQSAATKYHIPRETLRRHYQRYLKAMGIQKVPGTPSVGLDGGANSTAVKSSIATNNNAMLKPMDSSAEESSNGFSSLMDIGQAYGIWNPDLDGSDFKSKIKKNDTKKKGSSPDTLTTAAINVANEEQMQEEKEKELIIDEDDDSIVSQEESHVEEEGEKEAEEKEDATKMKEKKFASETAEFVSKTPPTLETVV